MDGVIWLTWLMIMIDKYLGWARIPAMIIIAVKLTCMFCHWVHVRRVKRWQIEQERKRRHAILLREMRAARKK